EVELGHGGHRRRPRRRQEWPNDPGPKAPARCQLLRSEETRPRRGLPIRPRRRGRVCRARLSRRREDLLRADRPRVRGGDCEAAGGGEGKEAGGGGGVTQEGWGEFRDPQMIVAYLYAGATDRRIRLFGCSCVRFVSSVIRKGMPFGVEIVESFADGLATKAALRRFRKEARAERRRLNDTEPMLRLQWAAYWLCEVIGTERAFVSIVAEIRRLEDAEVLKRVDWTTIQCLACDIFGNPFRPVAFDPCWRTSDAVGLARAIYDDKAFDRLPILADALMDAGCADEQVLAHCRGDGPH